MNQSVKANLVDALKKNIRLDGRKLDEVRKVEVKVGIISTADGSAQVKFGDTEVIAGVKLGVDKPYPDTQDSGTLMVNVELLPMSNPKYEMGPPQIGAIELSRVVDRGIREGGCMDTKSLCIEKGEKVWSVIIDVVPINDDGNLLDVAGFAALCALRNTVFPEFDGNKVNFEKKSGKKLEIKNEPIPVTLRKVGDLIIVDPTEEEDNATDSRLTITYLADGTVCSMQKGGDWPLMDKDVETMLKMGETVTNELRSKLPK